MLLSSLSKRIKWIFISVPLLLVAVYCGVAWYVMSKDIAVPILAIVTKDSYPGIPPILARAYLFASDYDPNARIRLGMPALNFIVNGYGLGDSWQKGAILKLSQGFINKGADINKRWDGFTPLQAAVLANEPIMVQLLLKNGADPILRLISPGKPYDNMTALELAEYFASQKKRDMERVIEILKTQHKMVDKPTTLRNAVGVGLVFR